MIEVTKIEPTELNVITANLYNGEDVYDFIKDLGVDRKTALKVLDFLKDYADDIEQSKSTDELYYENRINELEEELRNWRQSRNDK